MNQLTTLVGGLAHDTEHDPVTIARWFRRACADDVPLDLDGLVDAMVGAIDRALALQLDRVLGHPSFRRMESTWRGLCELLWRIPRGAGVRVELLSCSLHELAEDFEDAPGISKSGLYKLTHAAELARSGTRPYGAVVCHHELGPSDLLLLTLCAQVCALSHMPWLGQAGHALSDGDHPEWTAFRGREESRYVALVTGRWLVRAPYRRDAWSERPWSFRESDRALRTAAGVWLLAARMAQSFAVYRTPIHAFGPVDGRVDALAQFEGRCTERTPRLDEAEELDALGLISLVELGNGAAAIVGSSSCADPKRTATAIADPDERCVNTRLPAVLFAGRFAQQIKVLHRQQRSQIHRPEQLQAEVVEYLRTYMSDQAYRFDVPSRSAAEHALLEAIAEAPEAVEPLAAYADWLEAQGDRGRADFIRYEIALRGPDAETARSIHATWSADDVPAPLDRLARRGRCARILRGFEVRVFERPHAPAWWWFELRLELADWRGGRGCALVTEGRLDHD